VDMLAQYARWWSILTGGSAPSGVERRGLLNQTLCEFNTASWRPIATWTYEVRHVGREEQ
jgi:hypothetical protein